MYIPVHTDSSHMTQTASDSRSLYQDMSLGLQDTSHRDKSLGYPSSHRLHSMTSCVRSECKCLLLRHTCSLLDSSATCLSSRPPVMAQTNGDMQQSALAPVCGLQFAVILTAHWTLAWKACICCCKSKLMNSSK